MATGTARTKRKERMRVGEMGCASDEKGNSARSPSSFHILCNTDPSMVRTRSSPCRNHSIKIYEGEEGEGIMLGSCCEIWH